MPDTIPITTSRLMQSASHWLGWRYPRGGETQEIPHTVSGYPTSLYGTGTRCIDCSSFCAWMLMNHHSVLWTREAYEALQIYDAAKPFSNIDLLIDAGISPRITEPVPHRWHLVQTWEGAPGASPGHSRLAYHNDTFTARTLESTVSSVASGPQWRDIDWADLQSRHAMRLALV